VDGIFIPQNLGWPIAGGYLFADFVLGKLFVIQKDLELACRYCNPPVPSWSNTTFATNTARPVGLLFDENRKSIVLYGT